MDAEPFTIALAPDGAAPPLAPAAPRHAEALARAHAFLDATSSSADGQDPDGTGGGGDGALASAATVAAAPSPPVFDIEFTDEDARLGFALGMENQEVGSVAPGSAAEAGGLRRGDVLVAVAGLPVADMSGEEAVALICAKVRPMRLTFARPPQEQEEAGAADKAVATISIATAPPPPASRRPPAATAAAAAAAAGAAAAVAEDEGSVEFFPAGAPPSMRAAALSLLRARLDIVRVAAASMVGIAAVCAVSGPLSLLSSLLVLSQGLLWLRLAESPLLLLREASSASGACCCSFIGSALDDLYGLAVAGFVLALIEAFVLQCCIWLLVPRGVMPYCTSLNFSSYYPGQPSHFISCTIEDISRAENLNVFISWVHFAAGQSLTSAFVNIGLSAASLRLVPQLLFAVLELQRNAERASDKAAARRAGASVDNAALNSSESIGSVREWGANAPRQTARQRIEELERAVDALAARSSSGGSLGGRRRVNPACCRCCCHLTARWRLGLTLGVAVAAACVLGGCFTLLSAAK